MTGMGKAAVAAMITVLLSGCIAQLPPADSVQLAPVPGVALPFKARVMVFAGEADLARNLTIQISRFQSEETKVREGLALARATRAVLAKGFEQVEINDPSIRPQIVVKLIGKAAWSRQDAKMKLGCGIDVWTADGVPLGSFVARFDAKDSDYRSDLEPAFGQCLIKPVEELLNSPTLARLAGAGFRDPPEPATSAWMRTLGTFVPVR